MGKVITHAVLVLQDRVRLKNLTRKLQSEMEKDGFCIESDGYGHPSVLFDRAEPSALDNLFVWLADHKVAFEEDYKDIGGGPSGLMELIKDAGKYKRAFISCSYDGMQWRYFER